MKERIKVQTSYKTHDPEVMNFLLEKKKKYRTITGYIHTLVVEAMEREKTTTKESDDCK